MPTFRKINFLRFLSIFTLVFLCFLYSNSQTIADLYENRDFKKLVSYSDKIDSLNGDELYCIGFAFFQLEDDLNAIKMYDAAIEKGNTKDYVFLYKGLALQFDGQLSNARKNYHLAIAANPKGQKNYTELGNSFYHERKLDSALYYFQIARDQSFELGQPYYMVPHIYQLQSNYEKAIEEYYKSAGLIDKKDPFYSDITKQVAILEYTVTKNYKKCAEVLEKYIALNPDDFLSYETLIKALNASEQYKKANEYFELLRIAHNEEKLDAGAQKYGNITFANTEWNGRRVVVVKYFKEPTEMLDVIYKVLLLDEKGEDVERRLITEKTVQLEKNGPKHLLCERENDGDHITYSYGWKTDEISLEELLEACFKVFEGEIKVGASSTIKSKKD